MRRGRSEMKSDMRSDIGISGSEMRNGIRRGISEMGIGRNDMRSDNGSDMRREEVICVLVKVRRGSEVISEVI